MSYFPAFIKLDNVKILIVGGGHIAHEKLDHLLDFTTDITIIASEFSADMKALISEHALLYEQRTYREGDIKDFAIVVVAVDDIPLQAAIFEESRQYKCLCNAVDSVDYCDFIFPSYVKKGDLTIAFSTSGASPAVAKHLRRYLEKLIPDGIGTFLQEMKALRKIVPKGKNRMQMLDKKAQEYIKTWSEK